MSTHRDSSGETYVALLYSIVLGNGRRVVMSDLKEMAKGLGLASPRTVAATGNLVFEAVDATVEQLETALEVAFEARFGRHVSIIVRCAADWQALLQANPFEDESRTDPALVSVRVMRTALTDRAKTLMTPYVAEGERLAIVGGDLWVYFGRGHAGSRLATAATPKRLGVGTWRNWNTVRKLGEMVAV